MAEFKLFIDSVDGSLDIDGHANAPISYIIGVLADTCLDVLAQGVEGSKEFNDSIESLLVTIKNRADVVYGEKVAKEKEIKTEGGESNE